MRLLVIGSHMIGGLPKGTDAGLARADQAQDGMLVQTALETFDDGQQVIVHSARSTPFEKLIDQLCAGNGWENVHSNSFPVDGLDGMIAFIRPGTGGAIKEAARTAEAQGVQVVEFTV